MVLSILLKSRLLHLIECIKGQICILVLTRFNMIDRKGENIKTNSIFKIDFSQAPSILGTRRRKALDYLREALLTENEE